MKQLLNLDLIRGILIGIILNHIVLVIHALTISVQGIFLTQTTTIYDFVIPAVLALGHLLIVFTYLFLFYALFWKPVKFNKSIYVIFLILALLSILSQGINISAYFYMPSKYASFTISSLIESACNLLIELVAVWLAYQLRQKIKTP